MFVKVMLLVKLTAVILPTVLIISILMSNALSGSNSYGGAENKMSSVLPSINQTEGTLIVTKKVVNEGGGNKNPSDFIINVHANDPSPGSFPGNPFGISVKLHMGMYSVTETGPSGYKSTLSGDCSGGMMSVEVKNCTITNIYTKPVITGVK